MSAHTPEVKVGQVWEEVDPRLCRQVTVVAVDCNRVTIKNVRVTYANINRFNGKRGGYRLVKDVQ